MDLPHIDHSKLKERINFNGLNQNFNLEEWIFSNFSIKNYKQVLELFPGTGKQSEYLVSLLDEDAKIELIDASKECCEFLNDKFKNDKRVEAINETVDKFLENSYKKYDLIFASYGLYYSSLREDILCKKIVDKINQNGCFTTINPAFGNNIELFNLLKECGVKIPSSIEYCCGPFQKRIFEEMQHYSKTRNHKTTVNIQKWKQTNDVIQYWKNSIFFDNTKLWAVQHYLDKYFENNEYFVVSKCIAMDSFHF